MTMDRQIEGRGSADYLWNVKNVVPFLKVDKGLADEVDGAQVMKPMPGLDALLARAGVKYVRVRRDWGRRVSPSVVGNGGSRWCAALCGLCELDRVAESLELVDQSAGAVLGVLAGGEVVRAWVGEHFTSAQGVPDDVQQTVRHRDCGLVRAPASGDLVVLGAEVAALGSCGGAGRLDQGTSQPLVAGGGAYLAAFTGRLVVTGAQASPRRELSRGGEAAHVRACLGDDDLDAGVLQPGDRQQQVQDRLVALGDSLGDLATELGDRVIQEVQVGQDAVGDQGVMGAEVAGQR